MKKVMVCGCGAQGSTICRRLDEEPNIEEVVCADYDLAAAEAVCALMKKGTPRQVNAAHVDEIAGAAEGCELIVNVMPLEFGVNVMEAALRIKACYQDLSACENVVEGFPAYDTWLEGIRYMYTGSSWACSTRVTSRPHSGQFRLMGRLKGLVRIWRPFSKA